MLGRAARFWLVIGQKGRLLVRESGRVRGQDERRVGAGQRGKASEREAKQKTGPVVNAERNSSDVRQRVGARPLTCVSFLC